MRNLLFLTILTLSLSAFAEEEAAPVVEEAQVSSEVPASEGPASPGVVSTTSVSDAPANQGTRGDSASRELRSAARQEYRTTLDDLRQQLREARNVRREAFKAALALSGEERTAALKAAIEAFKEKRKEIQALRKAAREKYIAAVRNQNESSAVADANAAQEALDKNALENEAASSENLVATTEPQPEFVGDPLSAEVVEASPVIRDRGPACSSEQGNSCRASAVSAQ